MLGLSALAGWSTGAIIGAFIAGMMLASRGGFELERQSQAVYDFWRRSSSS
jgi:gas vesicle protein